MRQNTIRLLQKIGKWVVLYLLFVWQQAAGEAIFDSIEQGFVDNDGVAIHYVTQGSGPLVVLLHGFPDFWYTWRNLIPVLARDYKVVAIDLRGYNLSDKPAGVENYAMRFLVSDVSATIRQHTADRAIVIGHDWGGAIAWQVAIQQPQLVEKLIILSTPHPAGLARELSTNSEQAGNSQYAINFQAEDAYTKITMDFLTGWVKDPAAREYYEAAFAQSDIKAMLNYYRASFPASSRTGSVAPTTTPRRRVQAPTLAIFGLEDQQLSPAGFNGTWDYMDAELTLVAIPGAGHFVQHDAADAVTRAIVAWLQK